jgi:hypothetical protein
MASTTEETLARGVEALLHDAAARLGLSPGERDCLIAPDRDEVTARLEETMHAALVAAADRARATRSACARPPTTSRSSVSLTRHVHGCAAGLAEPPRRRSDSELLGDGCG